jgi:hypothetical protein
MAAPYLDPFSEYEALFTDPEDRLELARIKALRDPKSARRMQVLGAVGALATDEGLRGFGDNLYRTGAVQEDRGREAAERGMEGLKMTRQRAAERAESQGNWQKQFDAQQEQNRINNSLNARQEARMAASAAQGEWDVVPDPVRGGFVRINKRTGEIQPVSMPGMAGQGDQTAGLDMPILGAAGAPVEKYTESQRVGAVRSGEGTIALNRALNAGFPDEGRITSLPDTVMGMANRAGFPQAASERVQEQNTFWSNVADPIVRARTGAAMPVEEFNNQMAMLIPRPGESPTVQMGKAKQLVDFLKSGTVGLPPDQQQHLMRQLAQIEAAIPQDQDAWDQMRFTGKQGQGTTRQPGIGGVGGVNAPNSGRNFESEYGLGGR